MITHRLASAFRAFAAPNDSRVSNNSLQPRGRVAIRQSVNTALGDSFTSFPYSRTGSLYARYAQQYREILLAQEIYERESYASAIVHNIIDFGVGKGAFVEWDDEYIQGMWDNWHWSTQAKQSTPGELQRLAIAFLIRDGDIFCQIADQPEGIKMFFINPAYIRGWSMDKRQQGGVLVAPDNSPTGYIYRPVALPWQSLTPKAPDILSPDDILHVYKSEWDFQARGQSWLRKALVPLEALAKYDQFMLAAGEISVSANGYWTMPMKYLMEYEADHTDPVSANERAVIDAILDANTLDDMRSVQKLVSEIEWHEQPTTGVGDGRAIEAIHNMLAMRVCRGIGLSRFAVLLQYDQNVGFMAARNITEADKRFYEAVQMYLCQFLTGVCDRWVEHMTRTDAKFRSRYKGYEFYCQAQPYLDPIKDAKSWVELIKAGMASPQEGARSRGRNPAKVLAELKEYAQEMKAVKDETGIDFLAWSLGASAAEQEEMMQDAQDAADMASGEAAQP